MKSPDDVCKKYSTRNVCLKINVKEKIVFLEGSSLSLNFLADLIKAQLNYKKDDGFQISPNGAGKIFFYRGTKYGLYIRKIRTGYAQGK